MMSDIHKEGEDRSEMVTGAASLLRQLANNKAISIDAVRDKYTPDEIVAPPPAKLYAESIGDSDSDSDGSVSSKASSAAQPTQRPRSPLLSAKIINSRKAFALWKYSKINANNQYSPTHIDMDNTLEEIESELMKVQEESKMEYAVDIARNSMTALVGLVEKGANFQKVFNFRLQGWSEMVAFEIESAKYDAVFTELYDEYRTTFESISPLVKLIGMLGSSAFTYSMSEGMRSVGGIKNDPSEIRIPEPSVNINDIMENMRKMQEKSKQAGSVGDISDDDVDIRSPSPESESSIESDENDMEIAKPPTPKPDPPKAKPMTKKRAYKRKAENGLGRGKKMKINNENDNVIEILPDDRIKENSDLHESDSGEN